MKSRILALFVIALVLLVPFMLINVSRAGPDDDHSVDVYDIKGVYDLGPPSHNIAVNVEVEYCPACNPNIAGNPGPAPFSGGMDDGRYVAVRLCDPIGGGIISEPIKIVCTPSNCPLATLVTLNFVFGDTGLHVGDDVRAESDVYCSWCGHWYPTPATIHITQPPELKVTTDPPGIDTPTGSGFYLENTYAPISCDPFVGIIPDKMRYEFIGWTTSDMTEITDPSATSTTVYMDTDKTVTANYIIQYYLTVETFPSDLTPAPVPPSGWYDEGTDVTLTVLGTANYKYAPYIGYTFEWWLIDRWATRSIPVGSDVHPNPTVVHMDAPIWALAKYYRTVPDPIGDVNFDGVTDLRDIALIAKSYGAVKGDARYIVYYDVNLDGRIDLTDLAAAARHINL
jgi:uncharacterized repeat protein (TIGR02543 family)